jgi:hypothetical protein
MNVTKRTVPLRLRALIAEADSLFGPLFAYSVQGWSFPMGELACRNPERGRFLRTADVQVQVCLMTILLQEGRYGSTRTSQRFFYPQRDLDWNRGA